MAPLVRLLAVAALAATARAHFELLYPPTIGFDEDKESSGPCGGFTPDFTKPVTDFHVGGDSVATKLSHPQGKWLFRATLDQAATNNWTQVFPIVFQDGLGAFCEPRISVPASYAGQKGVIGVACNAPDGLLYQCAAVNFVAGTGSPQSQCNNASTVKISFTDDAQLSALVGGSSSPSPSGTGPSTSPSTSAPSPTKSPNAALSLYRDGGHLAGNVVAAGFLALLGATLMF